MTVIETDVLIVGAGAAGLTAALSACGRRVSILAAEEGGGTASECALGGIAAPVGADDAPELHLRDTLEAGHRGNSVPAVRLLCNDAAGAIEYLEQLGVAFARAPAAGQESECRERKSAGAAGYSLHKEAAHSRARVLHVDGDSTGAAIMRTLRARAREAKHIERLPAMRAVSLLCDSASVMGVVARSADGMVSNVRARAVVIATGGIGGLFARTTNPANACGDGLAMALRAGARCDALEFVQFHPTALNVDRYPLPLLTEALRGAGARLIDASGASVMRNVDPRGDLAPRDVVARAIYASQRAGRDVWLDATSLVDADVATAFPSAQRACIAHGIDPATQPIPVTPAAHYHMGGIAVDLDGRASLPRLWAAGEAACTGVHGANRLASNSLLEAVVFGRRLGAALHRERSTAVPPLRHAAAACDLSQSQSLSELREIMWNSMGLVRDARGFAEGLAGIARLCGQTPRSAVLEHSRLLLATHMIVAAARRTQSWGAHYREDALAALPRVG